MSTTQSNDEIDLAQLLQLVTKLFRKIVRQLLVFISFLKKKAILLGSLAVLGGIAGYFLDQSLHTKFSFEQEIIIEPKFGTTKYVYDVINELEQNFKDEDFLKTLGLTISQTEQIKKISIAPVIQATDVLDNLQERYEGKDFFKAVVEELEEEELEKEKYRNFYKNHKLCIQFNNKEKANTKVLDTILAYLTANVYYQNKQELVLQQTKESLARNKKSLAFIDEYLKNINTAEHQESSNEVIVIADESKTTTVASLLEQKTVLMEEIEKQEEVLALDTEVLTIVNRGDIIEKRKVLLNRMMTMIPMLLCGAVLLFFGIRQLFKQMHAFAQVED